MNCKDHLVDGCMEVSQEHCIEVLKQLSQGNTGDDTDILRNGKEDDHAKVAESESPTEKKRKLENSKLTAFLEKPLDPKVAADIDRRLLR